MIVPYPEVLLEHYRNPTHRGLVGGKTATVRNPLCGDEVTADVAPRTVGFEGVGCAISLGTADMLAAAVDDGEALPASEAELWAFIEMEPPEGRKRCATIALEAFLTARAG